MPASGLQNCPRASGPRAVLEALGRHFFHNPSKKGGILAQNCSCTRRSIQILEHTNQSEQNFFSNWQVTLCRSFIGSMVCVLCLVNFKTNSHWTCEPSFLFTNLCGFYEHSDIRTNIRIHTKIRIRPNFRIFCPRSFGFVRTLKNPASFGHCISVGLSADIIGR